MTKYEVIADIVGIPSDTPKEEPPTYYSRGAKIDITDTKVAERLLDLGGIKKPGAKVQPSEATSAEATEPVATTTTAPETTTAPATSEGEAEGETLTHKQRLVKEATERGLDTEGTIPELQKRIDEDKEKEEAGS